MVVKEVPPLVDDGSGSSSSTGAGALQKKSVTRKVTVNQAPFAYARRQHICQEVDAKLIDNAANPIERYKVKTKNIRNKTKSTKDNNSNQNSPLALVVSNIREIIFEIWNGSNDSINMLL